MPEPGTDLPLVVYKLGGSLLSVPDLVDRLEHLWAVRGLERRLIVVGGGAAADAVRAWDRTFQLPATVSHWLAIESLDLSGRLVLELAPEFRLVRSLRQMELVHQEGRVAVLCATCFMKWLETRPEALPHSWDVTSDSIAAAVASTWSADELVLLKSCDAEAGEGPEDWSCRGLVDSHFATTARGLKRIGWVNLASLPAPAEQTHSDPSCDTRITRDPDSV